MAVGKSIKPTNGDSGEEEPSQKTSKLILFYIIVCRTRP